LDSHITKLRSAIEEIRLLDTHPRKRWVNVHEILQELATEYRERLLGSRTIQFKFSDDLVDKRVYVDADHLRLVFRNLISNSLRATERRVVEDFLINGRPSVEETICIDVVKDSPPTLLTLRYSDNGLGVKEDLAPRLYVERCTDQRGSDHGLGGVIIRKLLDLSGGSIKLVSSIPYGAGKPCGTVQEITFPAAEDTTDQPQQPTLFSIKATTS
jgi:signal transduction histidine kinase